MTTFIIAIQISSKNATPVAADGKDSANDMSGGHPRSIDILLRNMINSMKIAVSVVNKSRLGPLGLIDKSGLGICSISLSLLSPQLTLRLSLSSLSL